MLNEQIKHLEMIQSVINRLAGNSSAVKGWAMAIAGGLFALAAKDADRRYVLVALYPTIALWILDGYFLYQERMYRRLYERFRTLAVANVRSGNGEKVPDDLFSLTIAPKETETPANATPSWREAMFSMTVAIFYVPILCVATGIFIVTIVRAGL